MFTRVNHWSQSWGRRIQSITSHPISLRSLWCYFNNIPNRTAETSLLCVIKCVNLHFVDISPWNRYLLTYLLTHSLTHSLHGAEYYLKSSMSLSLSKNILLSLWNPKVYHRVQKSPPLDPILSQMNPFRPSIAVSLRFSLMLSSHLRLVLPSGLLPSAMK
jgi:hypothetical protein